ncbi:hypothetical protein [Thalassobacillus pellis]|uniref:hypothetical protein n=1 Tax=Thalassobacillus pellis TaxID=748008 RepID=UPI0019617877|nr:hypothetical protein [Thalassobacillus pellis]MBM7553940.1 hypothetical protein [Thalassobacillus pellis]
MSFLCSDLLKGEDRNSMSKCFLLLLFSFTLLAACTQGEEEAGDYSGIISDGKAMGYEYTITKEQSTISWKIGYKRNTTIIKENTENEKDLEKFMIAVGDSQSELVELMITLSYFFIVALTTLFLYKKNRNMLRGSGVIITVFVGFAIYNAVTTSFDLSSSLHDAKYYYLILTN